MNSKYVVVLVAAGIPCLAFGQGSESYQCSYGDLQRRVQIFTEPGVSVPCEVHYYKDTEAPGERQILWSATNDAAYCAAKTEEFIGELQSWGWTCAPGDAPMPATEPAPAAAPQAEPAPAMETATESDLADDTEALTPATE